MVTEPFALAPDKNFSRVFLLSVFHCIFASSSRCYQLFLFCDIWFSLFNKAENQLLTLDVDLVTHIGILYVLQVGNKQIRTPYLCNALRSRKGYIEHVCAYYRTNTVNNEQINTKYPSRIYRYTD